MALSATSPTLSLTSSSRTARLARRRRIAANLGLNKDAVTKYLGRLREHGFVFQEESREVASARYEPCRYVLDPSAGIERFTVTPAEPRFK